MSFEACNGGTIFLDEIGDMSPKFWESRAEKFVTEFDNSELPWTRQWPSKSNPTGQRAASERRGG